MDASYFDARYKPHPGRARVWKAIAEYLQEFVPASSRVADIGAGTGYYSWRMAQRVGAGGTVYAVDIQPEMIKLLEEQMSRRGAANVKAVLGTPTDPGLPSAGIDLALMVDVYHELEYPYEMLAAIVRALKPGGRLVFVEFRSGDAAVPASK